MTRPNNQFINIDFTKLSLAFVLCTCLSTNVAALAGSNNFFGANAGGSGSSSGSSSGPSAGPSSGSSSSNAGDAGIDENVNAGLPGLTAPPAAPPSGDYTDDEKRVQRKYRGNVARAKQLIARGEGMMKSAPKEAKEYKKGRILKETGERWLADLKANDPYANEKPVAAGGESKDSSQKK